MNMLHDKVGCLADFALLPQHLLLEVALEVTIQG
jgi:hypothetical protein